MDTIDLEIPILIVCSKEDALIPSTSSIALFDALRKRGHKKAHLLVLDHGAHANILWGPDGHIYRNVVHAFYKLYGAPYNPVWAAQGEKHFSKV